MRNWYNYKKVDTSIRNSFWSRLKLRFSSFISWLLGAGKKNKQTPVISQLDPALSMSSNTFTMTRTMVPNNMSLATKSSAADSLIDICKFRRPTLSDHNLADEMQEIWHKFKAQLVARGISWEYLQAEWPSIQRLLHKEIHDVQHLMPYIAFIAKQPLDTALDEQALVLAKRFAAEQLGEDVNFTTGRFDSRVTVTELESDPALQEMLHKSLYAKFMLTMSCLLCWLGHAQKKYFRFNASYFTGRNSNFAYSYPRTFSREQSGFSQQIAEMQEQTIAICENIEVVRQDLVQLGAECRQFTNEIKKINDFLLCRLRVVPT